MNFSDAIALENQFVRLEPLCQAHHDDLVAAVKINDLWRTWYTHIPGPDTMTADITRRLALHAEGRMVPWAVIDPASSRAVGMTTYLNLDPGNRRVEIGSTWLGSTAQGTGINAAAKLLLLQRAFEELDCLAVEFRAHWSLGHDCRNICIFHLRILRVGRIVSWRRRSVYVDGGSRESVGTRST